MRVPRARIGGREALADSLGERDSFGGAGARRWRGCSRRGHESTSTPDFDFDLALAFVVAIDLAFGLVNDFDFDLALAFGLRGPSGRWGRIAADSVQMCAAARRRAS
jgi:hypothetical protein